MKQKYFELIFDKDDEGMCILGIRKPTPQEATAFVRKDLDSVYQSSKVVAVEEITREQAEAWFDMENHEFPVFGVADKEIER